MITFELFNKTSFRINKKNLNSILDSASKILKLKKNYSVSLVVIDNKEIKKINKIYRGINKSTDVLSFAEKDVKENYKDTAKTDGFLGEIIISYEKVITQAKENKIKMLDEFNNLLIHGLLHLQGYKHCKALEEKKMSAMHRKIINSYKK